MLHYILVQWMETGESKEELSRRAERLFTQAGLPDIIRRLKIRRAVVEGPNRCDLMICVELDGEQGLAAFDASLLHRQWKEEFGPVIRQKAIFDCEGTL